MLDTPLGASDRRTNCLIEEKGLFYQVGYLRVIGTENLMLQVLERFIHWLFHKDMWKVPN